MRMENVVNECLYIFTHEALLDSFWIHGRTFYSGVQ